MPVKSKPITDIGYYVLTGPPTECAQTLQQFQDVCEQYRQDRDRYWKDHDGYLKDCDLYRRLRRTKRGRFRKSTLDSPVRPKPPRSPWHDSAGHIRLPSLVTFVLDHRPLCAPLWIVRESTGNLQIILDASTPERAALLEAALAEDAPLRWPDAIEGWPPGWSRANDEATWYLFGEHFWFLKKSELLLDEQHIRLLFLEAIDSERQQFERLKRKFAGAAGARNVVRRDPIPESERIFVWRRDGGKCVRCGSNERLEFDHIIPVSKGGSNTARNLQLLCEICNRAKSDAI